MSSQHATEIQAPRKTNREPILDLVRIIACFIVVMHHSAVSLIFGEHLEATSAFWQNLRLGMLWITKFGSGTPIFFALAGWLVMNTLEKTEGDRRAIARSFVRRMRRILPPYWLALGLTAALISLMEAYGLKGLFAGGYALEFQSPGNLTVSQWIGNLTLSETWRPIISQGEAMVFTRVAWSLCYHEQFIAITVFAALLAGIHWRKTIICMMFSFLAIQILLRDSGTIYMLDGSFIDRWFCFAAGLIAYEAAQLPWQNRKKLIYLAILAGGFIAGLQDEDHEICFSAMTAIVLVAASEYCREHLTKKRELQLKNISPWTYPVFLAHLPVQTVSIRLLYEAGLQSFWQRALIVIPVTMVLGVLAGIAFGRLVNALEETEIKWGWLAELASSISGQLRWLTLQIWRAVAIEPILLPGWHIFPIPAQDSAASRCNS